MLTITLKFAENNDNGAVAVGVAPLSTNITLQPIIKKRKVGNIKKENDSSLGSDYIINLEFNTLESVDVVIKALNKVKTNMYLNNIPKAC